MTDDDQTRRSERIFASRLALLGTIAVTALGLSYGMPEWAAAVVLVVGVSIIFWWASS